MWVVLASVVFIAFLVASTTRFKLTDLLLIVGLNIPAGLLFGLLLGAIHNPVTRTFTYKSADQFRPAFEEVLRSLEFLPFEQARPALVYRCKSMRPPLPDISAEIGPESTQVKGSRHILGRIEKKMKESKNLTG
jgi:hypothetical protein